MDGFRYGLAQEIFGVFFQLHQYMALMVCALYSVPSMRTLPSVPIWRFTELIGALRFVTACRLALSPTSRSPFFVKATMLGVVMPPGGSGDDDRRLIFHNRHTAVCCSQINSDYLSHRLISSFPLSLFLCIVRFYCLAAAEHTEKLRQAQTLADASHALGIILKFFPVLPVFCACLAQDVQGTAVDIRGRVHLERLLDLLYGQHLPAEPMICQCT